LPDALTIVPEDRADVQIRPASSFCVVWREYHDGWSITVRFRSALLVLTVLVLISGISYAGWKYVHKRESHTCAACQRVVHEHTRTVAVADGKQRGYCCPACALSQHRQTGKAVAVLSLTDYSTGARLSPDNAVLVRGSDVNSCAHHPVAAGLDKQPIETHFDRCSPSVLAFNSKAQADAFAREHGGQVLRFSDFAALFR
jgi:hypothetical protein